MLKRLFEKDKKNKYGFFVNYSSWKEAQEHSLGYDSAKILEKVKSSLLQVKNGKAIFERDSVLFNKIEYSWGLLGGLLYAALNSDNKLRILDFGGSLGSHYFQNKNLLTNLNEIKWCIVEQKHFVDCGKEHFEDDILKFYYDIDTCIKEQSPNVIIFSSVLQYLENPYELLESVIDKGIKFIIFDRTSFTLKNKDILTIQKVPPEVYNASYPAWFFNKRKFFDLFKEKYELIAEFDALAGQIEIRDKNTKILAQDKGFIFKRR